MPAIEVAVAVIMDTQQRVLISLRPEHAHQGGLWEFPGGKLETGESAEHALRREIQEELGLTVKQMRPLIRIQHAYSERQVILHVYRVLHFVGEAKGCEGQAIKWVSVLDLQPQQFPLANRAIIRALQLPEQYVITPDYQGDMDSYLGRIETCLAAGARLIQFRSKQLDESQYRAVAAQVQGLVKRYNARLLLNTHVENVIQMDSDGVHLSSHRLMNVSSRPLSEDKILSVSCHNMAQLKQAEKIDADCALLAPVCETSSHPGARALGWDGFAEYVRQVSIPVYALGGMQPCDLNKAFRCGAQGIAAISAYFV